MANPKKKPTIPTTTSPVVSVKDLYVMGDRPSDPPDHPFHRRQHAPPTPEMIESIESDGVRIPIQIASIMVLRDEENLPELEIMKEEGWEDLFIVINGVRRVDSVREVNNRLAARGKPEMMIKTSLIEGGLMEAFATRMVSNDFDSKDPPSAKAALMASYAARRVSMVDIGRWAGVGEKQARNYVKMNKCVPAVKRAVDAGQITMAMAVANADLPAIEQEAKLAEVTAPPKTPGSGAGSESGSKSGGSKKSKPSAKLLKEISSLEGADEHLPKGFIECCRWVLGDYGTDDIAGLRVILDKIAGKPKAKRGRAKKS